MLPLCNDEKFSAVATLRNPLGLVLEREVFQSRVGVPFSFLFFFLLKRHDSPLGAAVFVENSSSYPKKFFLLTLNKPRRLKLALYNDPFDFYFTEL